MLPIPSGTREAFLRDVIWSGRREGKQARSIVVDLPVCMRCSGQEPDIIWLDWEKLSLRVACHRRIRDAVEEGGDRR